MLLLQYRQQHIFCALCPFILTQKAILPAFMIDNKPYLIRCKHLDFFRFIQ